MYKYADVLKKLQNASSRNAGKRLTAKHKAECMRRYVTKYPKRKRIEENAMSEFSDAVYEELKPEWDRICKASSAAHDKWELWLAKASQEEAPVVSTETRVIYSVSESSYCSQGWGARKYATGDAKSHMTSWEGEFPELTFEFKEIFHKYDAPFTSIGGERYTGYWEFQVLVNTDEVGCDIVKRRKVSIKEHYRALLKSGCNVRVLYPWLDHDFPESWGMDWSGNDIKEEVSK
jgi:hypothetical protein